MSTVETLLHVAVVSYAIFELAKSAYQQSISYETLRSDPAVWTGLKDGWLLGRSRDDSDIQWREFRGALPALSAALAGFVCVSRLVQALAPSYRVHAYILFSLIFIGVLHGACAAHVVLLLLANFLVAHLAAGRKQGEVVVWAWGCGTLLLARLTDGQPLTALGWTPLAAVEQHRGMLRWHIIYNMLLLRCISYSLDLHWARTGRPPRSPLPAGTPPSPDLDLKSRVELPLPAHLYRLPQYLAYVLYPPTYIAGPTITFNSFTSQITAPSAIPTSQVALYVARLGGALLSLEALTHLSYCNALGRFWVPVHIHKLGAASQDLQPLQVAAIGFWVLVFMWLKFLVMWRVMRAFALTDGVVVPENMTRCVCNNYDIEGFWKNWHASYNQWLVRYMYIPLGGARWRLLNVWPIFTFVAVWHDLELRLLGWAWLMCIFIAPEMVAKQLARSPPLSFLMPTYIGGKLAACAAAVNILCLMIANLVGFVLGTQNIAPFLAQALRQPQFTAAMLLSFFSAAHVMFAIRDREATRALGTRPAVHGKAAVA